MCTLAFNGVGGVCLGVVGQGKRMSALADPPPDQRWSLKQAVCILLEYIFVTARKQSLRSLCFHRCLSVHRGGCLPHCMLGYTPQEQTPPRPDTIPGNRHPPGSRHPPLPKQTPPAVHAGRYGQQAGGTHPTGMHTCVMSLFTKNKAAKPLTRLSNGLG